MTRCTLAALALLSACTPSAHAHRLDEYLQVTLLSVDRNEISASLRLIPGVAVAPTVLAGIDTDRDGRLSPAEQQAYVQLVLASLELRQDGAPLRPVLVAYRFSPPEELRSGTGQLRIQYRAALPRVDGPQHTLTLRSTMLHAASVYLVNATVPADASIHVENQTRNYRQSFYELKYRQDTPAISSHWRLLRSGLAGWRTAPILAALLAVVVFATRRLRAVRTA